VCNFTSSFGPFGLPRTVEVLHESVDFQSGNVLVVREGDLRFLLFARGDSKGRQTCEEQARAECGPPPHAASTFLEVGRSACGARPVCKAGPPQLSYAKSMIGGTLAFGQAQLSRVAVLGLGAGSLPLWFTRNLQGVRVDAVDVDADVMAAAPCFGLASEPRLNLVHADGRKYLEAQGNASLDALLVDVFDAEDIPPCLRTAEFFELVFRRLAPGGVLVMNSWQQHAASLRQAMAVAFPGERIFTGKAPGLGNVLLLVRRGESGSSPIARDVGDSAKWAKDATFTDQVEAREDGGASNHEVLRDVSACPKF